MTFKRVILIILTLLAIARIVLSLGSSLAQPQVQGRLELYQTQLVLQATEYKTPPNQELNIPLENLVGQNPYQLAEQKYQNAQQEAQQSQAQLQAQLTPQEGSSEVINLEDTLQAAQQQLQLQLQLKRAIAQTGDYIEQLQVKVGLLEVQQGNIEKARDIWKKSVNNSNSISVKQTAQLLQGLWQKPPTVGDKAEEVIQENLDGWFQYRALSQLYQVVQRPEDLNQLQQQEQVKAEQAIIKLSILGLVPTLGGFVGILLLVGLGIQWLLKKDQAILATNANVAWETPWNWEITWQVLVVGFFFFSQVFLPLFLPLVTQILGFDVPSFNLLQKASYILISYLLMTAGGLGILYLSIKPYLPLSEDWFRFKFLSRWFVWGFGGYLVAVPLVLLVSLLNQQLWQGQGGGNPIILLALQAQDKIALLIFFITASVAAPIFEEIIFRGFLLPSLTRYLPIWSAITLSALLFAIAHLSASEILPLTVLGIILGFVYTRSRNLLSSILLHSLWNSGTLLSLFLLGNG